jgi:RNA polymerase sigma-70 factor (ECF subfamily)
MKRNLLPMGRSEWTTTSTFLNDLGDFGNDAGWRRFVTRYEPAIRSYLRHMGVGPADVEDVLQEILLSVVRSWRSGTYDRSMGRLRSWVFGITYRRVVDAFRARLKERVTDVDGTRDAVPVEEIPDQSASESVWEREWRAALVGAAIVQLRGESADSAFRVFERLVIEERPPKDVALELGMTVNAVYQVKFRMLRRLGELTRTLAEEP